MEGTAVVLSERDLARRFGISGATLRRLRKLGEAPASIQLSERRRVYLQESVDEWLRRLQAAQRETQESGERLAALGYYDAPDKEAWIRERIGSR